MSAIRLDDAAYCSFCMKSQHDVAVMVAGPACVFICDECIAGCAEAAAAKRAELQHEAEIERCAPCAPAPLTIGMAFAAHILGDDTDG